jgi:hypothetical protein
MSEKTFKRIYYTTVYRKSEQDKRLMAYLEWKTKVICNMT